MKLLFVDTETGGLDPSKHSLLTVGLVGWEDGDIKFEREFNYQQPEYTVTSQALKVNNIDLTNFIGYDKNQLRDIIISLSRTFFNHEVIRLAGHNVSFDRSFLANHLDLNNLFYYRMIDTSSIITYLVAAGKLPSSIDGLQLALDYFNIESNKRHTALEDARVTALLFTKLIMLGVK